MYAENFKWYLKESAIFIFEEYCFQDLNLHKLLVSILLKVRHRKHTIRTCAINIAISLIREV